MTIARRLDMPETIIEEAREMVSPEDLRTQDMLDDIHQLRMKMAEERAEAHAARTEAKKMARELRERLATIEEEREEILRDARKEAEEAVETLQTEIRRLRNRLRAAGASVEAAGAVEEELQSLKSEMPTVEPRESPTPPQISESLDEEDITRPIREGDTVWVRPLKSKGEVLTVEDGDAEVQVGRARSQVSVWVLELWEEEETEEINEGV